MVIIPALRDTKQRIAEALHFAAVCAAQKVGVNEPELLSPEDLYDALEKASLPLFESLKALHSKYDAWLEFHSQVEAERSSGNLDAQQSVQQVQADNNLENARQDFLKTLHTTTT